MERLSRAALSAIFGNLISARKQRTGTAAVVEHEYEDVCTSIAEYESRCAYPNRSARSARVNGRAPIQQRPERTSEDAGLRRRPAA